VQQQQRRRRCAAVAAAVPEGLSGVTQLAASSFVVYALKGN
jgi:hypothetical protein